MYQQQLMRKNLFSAAPIDTIVGFFVSHGTKFYPFFLRRLPIRNIDTHFITSSHCSHFYGSITLSHSLSFSLPLSLILCPALSRTLGLINGNRNNLDLLLRPHKQSMRVGQIILLYNRCNKIGQRCPFISKISF